MIGCWACYRNPPEGKTPFQILIDHEDTLSDGFGFYGGNPDHVVSLMLAAKDREIAEAMDIIARMMKAVEECLKEAGPHPYGVTNWEFVNRAGVDAQNFVGRRAIEVKA